LEMTLTLPEHNVPSSTREHLQALLTSLEQARRDVTVALDRAERKTEKQFEKFKLKLPLQVGTICYLYRPALEAKHYKAFRFAHSGPFYISEQVSENVFRIRNLKTHKLVKEPVHLNHLTPVLLREERPPNTQIPGHYDASLPRPRLEVDEVPPNDLTDVEIDVTDSDTEKSDNEQSVGDGEEADTETLSVTACPGTPQLQAITELGIDDTEHSLSEHSQSTESEEQELQKLNTLKKSRPLPSIAPLLRRSKRLRERQNLKKPVRDEDFVSGKGLSSPDPESLDNFQEILKIHKGRYSNNELQYLVTWKDGTKNWVRYNDLNGLAKQAINQQTVPVTGKRRPRS